MQLLRLPSYLKFLNCAISRYRHQNLVIIEACADCCYGVFDLLDIFSKQKQDIAALDDLSSIMIIAARMELGRVKCKLGNFWFKW